jgi:hypothetical protein
MGFFSSFKRNQSNVGASGTDVDDKYQRTASLYPIRGEPQSAASSSGRSDLKKFGAKSFSYPSRPIDEVRLAYISSGLVVLAGADLAAASVPARATRWRSQYLLQSRRACEPRCFADC